MFRLSWFGLLVVCVGVAHGIITKGADMTKDISKTDVSTKKADIDAQASYSHSVYGGYGDNQLTPGYGGDGPGLGAFGGEGGYGFHGEDHHHGHHDHHHYYPKEHHKESHGGDGLHKILAIKGLLVPLAGVALLGAAAAFVTNPVLLQLGVISGTYGRRRRDVDNNGALNDADARLEAQARLGQIKALERFMSHVPKDEMYSQEKKLMASYLSCSGTQQNSCLERLACELHGPEAKSMPEETHIMSIVTKEIFNNDFVPLRTKQEMAEAVRRGKEGGDCSVYSCNDLEALMRSKKE